MRRHSIRFWWVFASVTALVLVVGGATIRRLAVTSPNPPRFETVDRGTVELKVTETGTMEPLKKVEVKSKVAGRIDHLYVDEGDVVHAGQLLAEIDPTEINSQVEQIRAQLDGARARYEQSKRAVLYQTEQTRATIGQSREGLKTAEARMHVAEEEDKLQPKLSSSEIAQARANLKGAQDSLSLLKSVTHPQAVVQAQAAFDDAQAQEKNSRLRQERERRLLSLGYTARQDYETAVTDVAAAKARLDQARVRLSLVQEGNRLEVANAQNRLAEVQAALDRAQANEAMVAIKTQEAFSARASVDQGKAQLAGALAGTQQDRMREDEVLAAQAAVKQLDQQLREVSVRQHDTRLVASMDGVVTRRYIEQGELVTSGVSTFSSGTPVLQISDLSRMLVKMSVNEVDVHKIRVGLPVEIVIDGVRGELFHGIVTQVAPAAGSGADTGSAGQQGGGGAAAGAGSVIRFAVTVRIDRPDPRLKPGMSARSTIVIARKTDVVRVPAACVEEADGGARVQVLITAWKDGKATPSYEQRPVTEGLRGDSHAEILSGLKPGARVRPGSFGGPKRHGFDMTPG